MGSLGWEAVHRLQAPLPLQGVTVMVVAGIGIVVNGPRRCCSCAGGKTT
jgi:cobalt-zinc-cadmium efflux system protein